MLISQKEKKNKKKLGEKFKVILSMQKKKKTIQHHSVRNKTLATKENRTERRKEKRNDEIT